MAGRGRSRPDEGPAPATDVHPSKRRWRQLPVDERLRFKVEGVMRSLWHRHGQRGTAERVAAYLHLPATDVPKVAAAMIDPVTLAALADDGIITDEDLTADGDRATGVAWPSSKQVDAVRAFIEQVDPDVPTSFTEALASVGVTRRQWNGWLRDPVFMAYFRDVAGHLFGDHALAMDAALLKQAMSGDVAALKLAYTVTGRLEPRNAVDPAVLVAHLLEIVMRHVADRETLRRCAEDLKAVVAATGAGPVAVVVTESGERVAG
jgi:hypothetical protein